MYISNPEKLKNSVKLKSKLGKYIEDKYMISPITKSEDFYYFSDTEELQNVLAKLNLFVRFFYK